ncbi:MAG: hypothetical protein GF372_15010 [Candidatus Marinimicrobia bacterium]|nr:hypothetical protein [Candidatus Neomarinimicrobiota bacterium]
MDTSRNNRFAVLDLGSNSFHLDIAKVNRKRVKKIHKQKEMVYLGRGLDSHGMIQNETLNRAFAALERICGHLKHLSRNNTMVVGTSILRQAKNSDYFLRTAENLIGHPIRVISGEEEADFIFTGVNQFYKKAKQSKLIIDIGGGSTEIIRGDGARVLDKESVKLGCGPITEKYFSTGQITRKAWTAALHEIAEIIGPYRRRFSRSAHEQVIGTSGTMKGIYRGLKSLKLSRKKSFKTSQLAELQTYLFNAGHTKNISLKKVKKRRKPVYPAGLAIFTGISKALRIKKVDISKAAVRKGILYSLFQRAEQRRLSHSRSRADFPAYVPDFA